ncbi:Zinc/iron permease [Martensiomyces pterosporus]|nr:Zinc/iron permease [Martensiomyces pterosporus]
MQAVFRLVLEGLAMFAGSWAAGCVPLYVRMDSARFNLLALFGAGLLIGAALAVILPEGVETLSKALESRKSKSETQNNLIESMNNTIGWALVAGFCVMFLIDNAFPSHSHDSAAEGGECPAGGQTGNMANDSAACLEDIAMSPRGRDARGRMATPEFALSEPANRHHLHQQQMASDSMSSFAIGVDDERNNGDARPPRNNAWDRRPAKPQSKWLRILSKVGMALSPRFLPSTLIGILVHSCADGLALGAAVAASSAAEAATSPKNAKDASAGEHTSSLEIIVFLALLLHKAPAALGLITTLKQQGYARYKLSVWLTVFAASAPLAALVTFAVFSLISPSTAQGASAGGVQPWTGTIMLFSAGTFMYVAMAHTLTEAVQQAKALRARGKSTASSAGHHGGGSLSLLDVVVLLFGVVLPPLVAKDHDG